jgi:asparagine N-glycosylation enzyme membrane subunit Stt3
MSAPLLRDSEERTECTYYFARSVLIFGKMCMFLCIGFFLITFILGPIFILSYVETDYTVRIFKEYVGVTMILCVVILISILLGFYIGRIYTWTKTVIHERNVRKATPPPVSVFSQEQEEPV